MQNAASLSQRQEEESSDYRYFPDPDLFPVTTTIEQITQRSVRHCLKRRQRRERFQAQLGLSEYDAAVILDQGPEFTAWFEGLAIVRRRQNSGELGDAGHSS
ncbi:MAG: hypothetical protein WKF77_06065 [Planctomycetaceae bacterium]